MRLCATRSNWPDQMTDPIQDPMSTQMEMPDPRAQFPARYPNGAPITNTVHLSEVIDQENFIVGDYTYASAFEPPEDWRERLAPYLFPGTPGRLILGRFCQIAEGVVFVTAAANHAMDGLTCYPFPIFDPDHIGSYAPDIRDTVIGNDVWFGMGAMVCPGARIGDGVIVGAGAVVRGLVPDYAVVTGNPAEVQRLRFSPPEIARLKALAWWDWPADRVAAARPALMKGDLDALETLAPPPDGG